MIRLTRLNGQQFLLNAEIIREVEATPDTIITLTTGEKLLVREGVEAVGNAVIKYKQLIHGVEPHADR